MSDLNRGVRADRDQAQPPKGGSGVETPNQARALDLHAWASHQLRVAHTEKRIRAIRVVGAAAQHFAFSGEKQKQWAGRIIETARPGALAEAQRLVELAAELRLVASDLLELPHLIPHSPDDTPPSPDLAIILAAIKELRTQMSQITANLARLSAEQPALAAELEQLIAALAEEPARVGLAVQGALAAAGADDVTTTAGVDAARAATEDLTDRIVEALRHPPAATITISPTSFSFKLPYLSEGRFEAEGGEGPYYFTTAGDEPPLFVLNEDGTYVYEPNSAEAGHFMLSVKDAEGLTGSAQIDYEITAAEG